MNKRTKIWVFVFSLILVFLFSFFPDFAIKINQDGDQYYGLPFDWLVLRPHGRFSFLWIGFLLNILFFYVICKIVIKIINKVLKKVTTKFKKC